MSTSVRRTVTGEVHAADGVGRILVVDDHAAARESVSDILRTHGHRVTAVSSASEALQICQREAFDVILTDLQMPGMDGLQLILELERRRYGAQAIMATAHATVTSAVEAMRHGAFDYIEKPFNAERLENLVARALAHGRLLDRAGADPGPDGAVAAPMIGDSPAMRALRERIARAAPTSETILITGESGVGKELVARAVHQASRRRAAALVSLNCPALSAALMESELFGHERGAFTGADAPRTGRFELADGGSILLDEITEIEPPLQAKLLRVLQEKAFERVGSSRTITVDTRVLATTNRDLLAEVAAGRFRQDLYYRLAVVPLHVPPLRERRDDVPRLVEYFLARAAERLGQEPCRLEPAAETLLVEYHWPGNVRELENIVTRASVLNAGRPVRADELRPWLIAAPGTALGTAAEPHDAVSAPVGLSLRDMERRLIEATLERFDGHRAKTAVALGIGIRTLSGKLKEYGYSPRERRLAKTG